MDDTCQRCNQLTEDIRIIEMSCGYAMNELPIPLGIENVLDSHGSFTLRVCKDCRAQWMESLVEWFKHPKKYERCGSGIWVRRYGANIEITEEEFKSKHPCIEPTRGVMTEEGSEITGEIKGDLDDFIFHYLRAYQSFEHVVATMPLEIKAKLDEYAQPLFISLIHAQKCIVKFIKAFDGVPKDET